MALERLDSAGQTAATLPGSGMAGDDRRRFAFIDALRGLAALAVCAVHFYSDGSYHGVLSRTFPHWMGAALERGTAGVHVFFVLSGFVIAYSIRQVRVTPRFLGNFALRRSLRLDPPYWVTIFIVLLLNAVGRRVFGDVGFEQPGVADVAMNMFYVPRLFARPFIVVVAWTLAIEIQFYLVLVTAVGLAQRLGKRPVMGYPTAGYAVIFTLLALASLANLAGVVHFSMDLFLSHWMLFFLGVLGWWSVEGSVWRGWFWIYAALTAMTGGVHEGGDRLLIGLVAAVAIFIGGARGRLYDWWDAAPLQFLGRISYSLYLGHAIIGGKTVKLGHRLLGDSPVAAVGVFVLAFVVSIAGAYVMYVALERPSVRLAKRVKLKPAMTPPATEAAIPQERMASAAPEPDPAPAASASAAPVLPPAAQDAISANVIST